MGLLSKKSKRAPESEDFFFDPGGGERIAALKLTRPPLRPAEQAIDDLIRSRDHEAAAAAIYALPTAAERARVCRNFNGDDIEESTEPVKDYLIPLGLSMVRHAPQHPISHAMLAGARTNRAWEIRGGGWSDTVSREQWTAFHSLLRSADTDARRAIRLGAEAEGFTQAITIAMGLGAPVPEKIWLFEQAHKAEPFFYPAMLNLFVGLQERWSGDAKVGLDLIRLLVKDAPPSSLAPGVLPIAIFERAVWEGHDFRLHFDNAPMQRELIDAFDRFVEGLTLPLTTDIRWALTTFAVVLHDAAAHKRVRQALQFLGDHPDPDPLHHRFGASWPDQYQLIRHRLALLGAIPRVRLVGVDLTEQDWAEGRVPVQMPPPHHS